MNKVEIKVPHAAFSVQAFDGENWVSTESDVICNEQEKEGQHNFNDENCRMYVSQTILPGAIGLLELIYDAAAVDSCTVSEDTFIESEELKLTYDTTMTDLTGVIFSIENKLTGEITPLGFSLRYWQSYQGDWAGNNQPSGAYIFRPTKDQFESYPYSEVSSIVVNKCPGAESMIITFTGSSRPLQGNSVVTITLDELPIIKYEVELYGIPQNADIGFEVTVNFEAFDLNNDEVFYTDSNGLEMQRRQLNFRPTWNLTT
jgi:hypothetical protein